MAKKNLLEIVQDILSDLETDEVNSITDTVEAMQVAQIVKTTYEAIINARDWPFLDTLFQLEAGTVGAPTHMKIPENITEIQWVKYNTRKVNDTRDKMTEIEYKTPGEFLYRLEQRPSDDVNIQVVSDPSSGVSLNVYTDRAPSFYTSFDDTYVVFDSFDINVDSVLQNSKSQSYGKRSPDFTMDDTFIPDLPAQMFSYLMNESKSVAFVILKQSGNPKAEQHSISQRRRMSQDAWRVRKGITYPNYGRK